MDANLGRGALARGWGISLSTAVLSWILAPASALAQAEDFTLVALPDTQYYTCTSGGSCESGLGIFATQTGWVEANRDVRDIRFVTLLGDCAQNGNVTAEYDIAAAAFQTIEEATGPGYAEGIPFGIAIGNHDQFPVGDPGSIPSVGDVNHPDQAMTTTTYMTTMTARPP